MLNWKPLGARRSSNSISSNELPGQRGVRIIYVPQIVPNRYVHFSWRDESFCIRDYIGEREMRQMPDFKALDVWKQHEGPVFSEKRPVEDVEFWTNKLIEITAETGVGKKDARE